MKAATQSAQTTDTPELEYQCLEQVGSESGKTRHEEALDVVRRNVYWAMGGSLIPLPIVDKVVVTGIQLKLLKELSDKYGVPFSESIAAKIVATLVAGLGSMEIAKSIAMSGLKTIPLIGSIAAVLTYPAFAGALTYATGKVFVMHYELGGTLLTLDVEKAKTYFAKQFHEGKLVVAQFCKG